MCLTISSASPTGWRYYRVGNIAEQLGTLGWELLLSNQVPGTRLPCAAKRGAGALEPT